MAELCKRVDRLALGLLLLHVDLDVAVFPLDVGSQHVGHQFVHDALHSPVNRIRATGPLTCIPIRKKTTIHIYLYSRISGYPRYLGG